MTTNSSSNYLALLERIRAHAPGLHHEADLPLTITQQEAEAVLHVVHDIGGQPRRTPR